MSRADVALARRLGTRDAVVVGLGAMVGAGVFSVFAPAAGAAGGLLFAGLGIAALVALCNATSSAQLAAIYPSSGGTYLFGREVLGPWWGFLAGWGFVIGKTASCAAMAVTFAAYVVPDDGAGRRAVAVAAVVAMTAANLRGITRTARTAALLLAVTAMVLLVVVAVSQWHTRAGGAASIPTTDLYGVLQSAGLLFFAFAGYARIATLAEEVRRPEDIGRAVLLALGITVVLYAVVGLTVVRALGPDLIGSTRPLSDAVRATGEGWLVPVVAVGAATASLGALLSLLTGVSRTSLAMARGHDLPGWLAAIDCRAQVPARAQCLIGVVVALLAATLDLRHAIGFSSFGVLTYYAVANLSALRQPASQRRWPRGLQVVGLSGCALLAFTLPVASMVSGVVVLAIGVVGRSVAHRRR